MKTPSFKPFISSSSKASRHLSRIKSIDNRTDKMLRSTLWKMGLRFKKHVRTLPGKPDIVFTRQRVVVFCDGDFWHGREWRKDKRRLGAGPNATYWVAKIQANIKRDKQRNRELRKLGWRVVRVWESNARKNPHKAIQEIKAALFGRLM